MALLRTKKKKIHIFIKIIAKNFLDCKNYFIFFITIVLVKYTLFKAIATKTI